MYYFQQGSQDQAGVEYTQRIGKTINQLTSPKETENADDEYPPFVIIKKDEKIKERLVEISAQFNVDIEDLYVFETNNKIQVWLPEIDNYYIRMDDWAYTGDHVTMYSVLKYYYDAVPSTFGSLSKNLRVYESKRTVNLEKKYHKGDLVFLRKINIPYEVKHFWSLRASSNLSKLSEQFNTKTAIAAVKITTLLSNTYNLQALNLIDFIQTTKDIDYLSQQGKEQNDYLVKKILSVGISGMDIYQSLDNGIKDAYKAVPAWSSLIKHKPALRVGSKFKYYSILKHSRGIGKSFGFIGSVVLSIALDSIIDYMVDIDKNEQQITESKFLREMQNKFISETSDTRNELVDKHVAELIKSVNHIYQGDFSSSKDIRKENKRIRGALGDLNQLIDELNIALQKLDSEKNSLKMSHDMLKSWVLENTGGYNDDSKLDAQGNTQESNETWKNAVSKVTEYDSDFASVYALNGSQNLPYFQMKRQFKAFGISSDLLRDKLDPSTSIVGKKNELQRIKGNEYGRTRGSDENKVYFAIKHSEVKNPTQLGKMIEKYQAYSNLWKIQNWQTDQTLISGIEKDWENKEDDSFMFVFKLESKKVSGNWIQYIEQVEYYYNEDSEVTETNFDYYGWYNTNG